MGKANKKPMRMDTVPFWHFIVATVIVVVTLIVALIIGGTGTFQPLLFITNNLLFFFFNFQQHPNPKTPTRFTVTTVIITVTSGTHRTVKVMLNQIL